MITVQFHVSIILIIVINKMPCSDHLPIAATFDICNKLPEAQSRNIDKDSCVVRFNWYKTDANCIK